MSHYDEQRETDDIWRNAPATATHYGGGKYWRMHDSGNYWETEHAFMWVYSCESPQSFSDYCERLQLAVNPNQDKQDTECKLSRYAQSGAREQKLMEELVAKRKARHDPVNNPKHYAIAPNIEAIDIIKASLTPEQFKGYLLGNFLKYRLRAGDKGDLQQDIDKSNWYRERLNSQREAE